MKQIRTAAGELFQVKWAGVSTIDGILRFAVIGSDAAALFNAFSKPDNCSTITRVFDNLEQEFTGYSNFRGIQVEADGSIIVSLSR